jgi:hypothetical protein
LITDAVLKRQRAFSDAPLRPASGRAATERWQVNAIRPAEPLLEMEFGGAVDLSLD